MRNEITANLFLKLVQYSVITLPLNDRSLITVVSLALQLFYGVRNRKKPAEYT